MSRRSQRVSIIIPTYNHSELWLHPGDRDYQILVVDDSNGTVIGWSPLKQRQAFVKQNSWNRSISNTVNPRRVVEQFTEVVCTLW